MMREEDEQAFFEDPEFQEVLRKYEEARRSGAPFYMDADDLTDIAEYYMVQEREEQADEAIRIATELHPESVDPQVFLARQQMFHDNLEKAHEICDAIIDQDDSEVRFLKAGLMMREQKSQEASDFLMDCYERMTSDRANFLYDCAGVFMDYALWDEAQVFARRLLDEYPGYRKGPSLMADVLVSKGSYEEAIPLLDKILDDDPYQIGAWNLLAESQGALEQFQEAIESTEYVLAIDENNQRAVITKANCLFHLDQLEEAHSLYKIYLERNPQDSVVYYLDAVCLADLERYEESAAQLTAANEVSSEMSPEQLNIYMQQAFVESRLRHLDRAIAAIDKARKIAPEDSNDNEYELQLGRIFLENNRASEAGVHFRQALHVSKDRKKTYFRMGVAFADVEFYQLAKGVFEMLQTSYGESMNADVVPYLAYCYSHLGENEKYLSSLKEAVRCNPQVTKVLFSPTFPGVSPDEYYLYAFKSVYGRFPKDDE
jgi:tetratricopeptide (TPR) repeat protein